MCIYIYMYLHIYIYLYVCIYIEEDCEPNMLFEFSFFNNIIIIIVTDFFPSSDIFRT